MTGDRATVRLVTAAAIADLFAGEEEDAGYAPASAADITAIAARTGWLSRDKWLYPAVPASRPLAQPGPGRVEPL